MKINSFEIITIVYVIGMACFNLLYSSSFKKLNDRVKSLEEKMYLFIEINKNEVEVIKKLNENHQYLVNIFNQIESADVRFRFDKDNPTKTEKKTLN
ncbi:hypothetical protein [Gallibacterium anatis]|uniref:hypothetical protein n=1 Tax=Gallibacterium anatis TaxID=750 RepID=UPI0026706DD9|nr:hypothetical protein [Gallibacterium anatis]WKS98359.1 hypothetical protein NYR19_06210 [Gallibacterium anatis]